MKIPTHIKKTALVAAVLSTLGPAGIASAAELSEDTVYQSLGSPVRSGATGTCVRTGFWTPGTPSTGACGEDTAANKPPPVAQTPAKQDTAAQSPPPAQESTPPVQPAPTAKTEPAAPPAESVPEFVSEPEPHDMVPVPPVTAAPDDDQKISEPAQFYDEEKMTARSDGLSQPKENAKFSEDVAAAEAEMAKRDAATAAPPAQPAITANAVQQAAPPAQQAAAKQSRHLTLNGEAYFGFDKYALTPAGKEKIDELVADLGGTRFDIISLTGHADRIGSKPYNKKLSEQRALSVKRYLAKKGVTANKVETKWVGSSDPATAPGACEGLDRKQTITCLAPDRRVEMEVTGMREK
jgi:OmpA-OmpF porin, OOP family